MSNRKPYIREIKPNWWQQKKFYRHYMLREATVLPLILFSLCFICGLGSLVKGPQAWNNWLEWMSSPFGILIGLATLVASLYHAYTFFSMMPKVMPVNYKGKQVDEKTLVLGQWAVVAAISLIGLIIV